LQVVNRLDELIAQQTRALEQMAEQDARARWLQTVPGIGAYSAMVILAEVGNITDMTQAGAGQLCGLTPSLRESAGSASAEALDIMDPVRLRWIMLQ